MLKICFCIMPALFLITVAAGEGQAESRRTGLSHMTIESPKISMVFGPKLDVKSARLGTSRAACQGHSVYAMCGQPAEIVSVIHEENLIRAQLRNRMAEAELMIEGGDEIAVRFRATGKPNSEARGLVSSLSITLPLPLDSQVQATDHIWEVPRMPVGKTAQLLPLNIQGHQFGLVECGGLCTRVGTKSEPRYFPKAQLSRRKKCATITWTWEPKAPFPKRWQTPELRLETFDSVDSAVEDYRNWAASVFDYQKLEENPRVPAWFLNTRLVLSMDLWLMNGTILHDYHDVIELIEKLQALRVPEDTILYLTGWSYIYDNRYPEYLAAEKLGGESAFKSLVATAHQAGYRIMVHTNFYGMDQTLPNYPEYADSRVVDVRGNEVTYPNIKWICPAAKNWRNYFVSKVTAAVHRYDLDAVLLDQAFAVRNCPHCDFDEGIPLLMEALYENNPGVLFGAEIAAERYIHLAPLCQWLVHNTPSLENYFNPDNPNGCVRPSPLRQKLYGDYARFCAHLFLPAAVPTPSVTGQLNRFQRLLGAKEAFLQTQKVLDQTGCIKSLRINYSDHTIDPLTRQHLKKLAE